jgi:hypothetical protein
MTRTRSLTVLSVFLLLALVASIWYGLYAQNDAYGDGFDDGANAVVTAIHGSTAKATNGRDEGEMSPYHCTSRDHSTNFRDARALCWNSNFNQRKEVRDWNGKGDGGNTDSMRFRGKYHAECVGHNAGCGHSHEH